MWPRTARPYIGVIVGHGVSSIVAKPPIGSREIGQNHPTGRQRGNGNLYETHDPMWKRELSMTDIETPPSPNAPHAEQVVYYRAMARMGDPNVISGETLRGVGPEMAEGARRGLCQPVRRKAT